MPVLPLCGGGLGTGGVGSVPFGTGFGLGILGAVATSTRAVDVTFLGIPQASDPATIFDALRVKNWSLVAVDPFGAQPRLVQAVERAEPSVIRVFVDGALERGATYAVSVINVESEYGIPIDPACTSAQFVAFGTTRLPPDQEALRDERTDIANPSSEIDAVQPGVLGTYPLDDRRDYALDRGVSYLRKRMLRRASTALGSFFHLPGYGFANGLKTLLRPGVLAKIQQRAQAQLVQEPDIVRATVRVSVSEKNRSMLIINMRATSVGGDVEVATLSVNIEQ